MTIAGLKKGNTGGGWLPFSMHNPIFLSMVIYAYKIEPLFWYKASLRKNFRVGSPDLWKLHKQMYNPKYLQQKEDDAKKATKKTNLKITKTK